MRDRPNILLVMSDQERQRDWLPDDAELPNRQRLLDEGLELTQCYTHTSPCSPSRATLFTGRYMAEHGVTENSTGPENTELRKDVDTIGHMLRRRGYRTSYQGKWHLEVGPHPDLDAYGFGDWAGNDMAFWGLPGSGTEYDPFIAGRAAAWLDEHGDSADPWFLVVALVNPHDIMWFPLDQAWWAEANAEFVAVQRKRLNKRLWGRDDNLPMFTDELRDYGLPVPDNFDDDLHTKPEVQRRWMREMLRRSAPGEMRRDDPDIWRRQLDYYVRLHEMNDVHLGTVLGALDRCGAADDTVVLFTSDHGDQCGSHGLRSKGPWNYQETMRIPLYVRAPGAIEPGTKSDSLVSSVDVTRTIAELAGADAAADLPGRDLAPLFTDPSATVRDHVLFAQRWPWYPGVEQTRYASSGIFDGRHKYCRYYGVGGGADTVGVKLPGEMDIGPDSPFEDHDHEWYDLAEDPGELVNLANDRSRRNELRERFEDLLAVEAAELSLIGGEAS